MPWSKSTGKRATLETATEPIPLLKDVWVKSKLLLTHIAGLSSLLSTMNTESAHQRYAIERLAHEVRTLREDSDQRWTEDQARWARMGEP